MSDTKRDCKIKKVFIANRGEIAARIVRTCRRLRIRTVVGCSAADEAAFAARCADEVVVLGPAAARESYLVIDKVVRAAVDSGSDAVHPGYGFLSERSEFAAAVSQAGLIFIGPNAQSIEALGSKVNARRMVSAAGVPITSGSGDAATDTELIKAAEGAAYPLIIKAVGGGGGRGMRIVRSMDELKKSIPLARSEALKNFGNDAVYFEKFIENPRHVEVQILGDMHGTILHLGTRDCSAQRRHQKLVEEAPAPLLSPTVRERLHQAAITAARVAGYYNAGTAEFLVSGEEFYFLEMNTRIQVEHPVTEAITGLDLVELQLLVAEGKPLPVSQSDIGFQGHAIEFRINAEDPRTNFTPSTGILRKIRRPAAEWLREDFGYQQGDEIPRYYDSMTSKLIVKGATRDEAIRRGYEALRDYEIEGVESTVPFHRWLLMTREFQRGGFDIGFVERCFTAGELDRLSSIEEREPGYRDAVAGALYEERRVFSKGGADFSVRLIHEREGTFLAIPCDEGDNPLPKEQWRRSNRIDSALRAVMEAATAR